MNASGPDELSFLEPFAVIYPGDGYSLRGYLLLPERFTTDAFLLRTQNFLDGLAPWSTRSEHQLHGAEGFPSFTSPCRQASTAACVRSSR
jgi:hypothetical protein